jgi:hypothetical protein
MDTSEDAGRPGSGAVEPGEVLRIRIFKGLESAVVERVADEVSRTLASELVSRIGTERLSRMDLAAVSDAALQEVQKVMDLPSDQWPEGGLPGLTAEVARRLPTPPPTGKEVLALLWGIGVPLLLVPLWWKPFGDLPLLWKVAGTVTLLVAWWTGLHLATSPATPTEAHGGGAREMETKAPVPLSRQQKGSLVTGAGFLLALIAIWWKPLGGLDWEMKALASAGAAILWLIIDHLSGFEK